MRSEIEAPGDLRLHTCDDASTRNLRFGKQGNTETPKTNLIHTVSYIFDFWPIFCWWHQVCSLCYGSLSQMDNWVWPHILVILLKYFSWSNKNNINQMPRFIQKRPTRLRFEIEIEWNSKCNRLYILFTHLPTHSRTLTLTYSLTHNISFTLSNTHAHTHSRPLSFSLSHAQHRQNLDLKNESRNANFLATRSLHFSELPTLTLLQIPLPVRPSLDAVTHSTHHHVTWRALTCLSKSNDTTSRDTYIY